VINNGQTVLRPSSVSTVVAVLMLHNVVPVEFRALLFHTMTRLAAVPARASASLGGLAWHFQGNRLITGGLYSR
jgi:hypothetical protein